MHKNWQFFKASLFVPFLSYYSLATLLPWYQHSSVLQLLFQKPLSTQAISFLMLVRAIHPIVAVSGAYKGQGRNQRKFDFLRWSLYQFNSSLNLLSCSDNNSQTRASCCHQHSYHPRSAIQMHQLRLTLVPPSSYTNLQYLDVRECEINIIDLERVLLRCVCLKFLGVR